jgi:hypothetical protein
MMTSPWSCDVLNGVREVSSAASGRCASIDYGLLQPVHVACARLLHATREAECIRTVKGESL